MGIFIPRLSGDDIYGNPYWYSSGNPFAGYENGMPNCTCYAWGRFWEISGVVPHLPTGDAGTWWYNVSGYEVGQTPRLGAIACYSKEGDYGHVGVVEQIKANGDIVTSNSGYDANYRGEAGPQSPKWFMVWDILASNNYNDPPYVLQGFIYNPFTGSSVSKYVIAAMCGCFKRESNVNPGIWESLTPTSFDHEYQYDGIGGYGLGQWTNVGTPHGRCWRLHEWVTSNGYQDGDGNGQLAFLMHEAYWANSSYTRGDYTTLDEFLATDSTNLDDLVWDFLANWEGVPGDAYDERLAAARLFLNYINEHSGDNPSDYSWISVNNYLSESQMCNNVMCAYFYFTSIAPQPQPQPTRRRKMPLWMYLRQF